MDQTAKIFTNGRSQAVRLPAAFRFDTKEVFIRQDSASGDVILSRKPSSWDGFFAALQAADGPDEAFLGAAEREQGHHGHEDHPGHQVRDPLDGWNP